jgi:tRNA (guanine37-N1)-methyltransferase
LRESLLGKAIDAGTIEIAIHDLRSWTSDVHRTVDDAPYGGGPGMVMKPDVWGRALDALRAEPSGTTGTENTGAAPTLVVPTPAGERFTQAVAAELATVPHLIFACGRYEGIDQRVVLDAARRMPVRELSIGDYVLAGGEAAVLVMVEAIARLLPGVLGNPDSVVDDSFGAGRPGLLEHPSYTRPAVYRDLPVPPVLLSGNHAAVARYRRDESLRRTAAHRPDLVAALDPAELDAADLAVLADVAVPADDEGAGPDGG